MPIAPERVVEYLHGEAGRPLKAKELANALDVATADYPEFKELLQRLEDDGLVYRVQRQRYAAPDRINLVVGRLQTTRSGAGFVTPDEGGADVYVPQDSLGSALAGDRVVARVERQRRGPRREGQVIRVLERARQTIVGTYHPGRNFGFVVPEDARLPRDVYVAQEAAGGATEGDVVVVRVTNWGTEHRGPAGEVERVLGRLGAPGVDVLAVAYGHELPLEFPPPVETEAEALRERGITAADRAGRTDLRTTLVFTIDPADAKDHDDALSIRALDEGWEVGVHIADVAHYVREGTSLDVEAFARGTSVYLVDRVIPMLPDALSSDLCSLVPDQDRLTLSAILHLDSNGKLRRHRLVRSVIRSRHKLAYETAQAVLEGRESVDAETDTAIRQLASLARRLRAERAARGSIDFDVPEARVVLNAAGDPINIERITRLESHRLIEDFMLLANETIAASAAKAKLPFIYRIHEPPDTTRMEQLAQFAGSLGYRVSGIEDPEPKTLQALLDAARGRPEEALLSTVVLRSMKQARYSERNEGHFGLAARHYTHFTSPIRRYPDLVVHRLSAQALIDGAAAGDGVSEALPLIARRSSERERVAVAAERDSIELKKVEFMERHLGDTFEGTIGGVRAFGFFVLLDTFFVEGLVHVSSLDDDYYEYLEEQYLLIGTRTRRQFRLGDRVRIRVAAVDLEERRIEFALLEALTPREVAADGTGRKGRKAGGAKAGPKAGAKAGTKAGTKGIRKTAEKPKNKGKIKKKRRTDGRGKGRGKR